MVSLQVSELASEHRFLLTSRQYTQQYSHIYFCRLNQIRPALVQRAKAKWPYSFHLERTLDSVVGRECFVVGTIYNENPEKPNILNEIEQEYHLKAVSGPKDSYYSSCDNRWYLEDEHGRIELKFAQEPLYLVTGMVVAVLGTERPDGFFAVQDWTLSGIPTSPPKPTLNSDCWIAIASDVRFNCSSHSNSPLEFEMLKDLLLGNLPGIQEYFIHALVLCGNVLQEPERTVQDGQKTKFGVANYKYDTRHFDLFDESVCELTQANRHVILVPGHTDPTNSSLPQQPVHPNLFHKVTEKAFLHLSTNPSIVSLNGVHILASAGEALQDALRHCNPHVTSPMQLMEQLLEGRHLAPTAPDTLGKQVCMLIILGCYPFYETDPFVLMDRESPHLILCGNQPSFHINTVGSHNTKTTIVMIPSFVREHVVVLMNLRDFECKLINIGVSNE